MCFFIIILHRSEECLRMLRIGGVFGMKLIAWNSPEMRVSYQSDLVLILYRAIKISIKLDI